MTTDHATIRIVKESCDIAANNLAANVVLETSLEGEQAIVALKSADARNMAISYAASKGINRPGINESPDVYPITGNGTPLDQAQQKAASDGVNPNHPDLQMAGYRARIRVVGNPV